MQSMASEYKLECYRKIKPVGVKGNLWIVEDSVTRDCYVMRKLPMDLLEVYQRLAAIHHANIVEIIDIFSCNGFLYVIEEYLEGETLSDIKDAGKLPRRQVLSVGRSLFNALLVLHGHDIVHRDIKPENIMMDAHGNVRLIDFDIARLFAENKSGDTTVKGSRDYAPPEQFGFSQTDRRADIYSLGVTLNELAVGELPENKICGGKLGIVVRHCTEFDPKKRYQNAAQALKHINLLEKSTTLLILSALVFFLAAVVKIFVFPDGLAAVFENENQFENEALFEASESLDRIIDVQSPEQYPAFLMTENKEYDFAVNLNDSLIMRAAARKNNEQMTLDCTLSNGSSTTVRFCDTYSSIYKAQGHQNNIKFEKTAPEYEILLDDIDENGVAELLVTLAWRHRVDTPEPENRFYFTEYSILWVIYLTEDNKLICSEPLYFNGCVPALQTDSVIFNGMYGESHIFYDGVWH